MLIFAPIIVGLLFFIFLTDNFGLHNVKVNAHSNPNLLDVKKVKNNTSTQILNAPTNNVSFSKTAPGEISFSFNAYANPQRPFPGYQGVWQLGPVRISGSGVVRASDGKLLRGGYITHSDNTTRARRYKYHRTSWRVVRGLGVDKKSGVTVLRLLVRVTSSNYSRICPVGTRGVLRLTDDNRRMSNRQTRDSVSTQMPNPFSRAADGGAACRTHVHGFNNVSYSWTTPRFGGPGGGNRANVSIKVEATNSSRCKIAGSWRQNTRGVGTSIWTFTHLGGNRYRATERGSGNARGTAILRGNVLRLDASTRTLRGYYEWTLNRNCRFGRGKLVFTRGRRSTHTSTIVPVKTGGGGGGNPLGLYRRYTNTGINASFDINHIYRNKSANGCSIECNKYSWCRSFEYIPKRRLCFLHRSTARKSKRGVEAYIKR